MVAMDPKSTFIKRFGDLVALLRAEPGNDAAQELALSAAAAAVAHAPLRVEAGVEWTAIPPDMSLKARMLARQVESLTIAAGAAPEELQSLARALAHDVTPIPTSPNVEVSLVRLLAGPPESPDPPLGGGSPGGAPVRGADPPANRRGGLDRRSHDDRRRTTRARWFELERRRRGDRRSRGERRLFLVHDQETETARLLEAMARASAARAWEELLYGAHALVRLLPRVPQRERAGVALKVRRAVSPAAREGILDLAERDYVVREPAAEVLRWIGLDAAESILDRLRQGEALGVRVFYYEVVGRLPAAYPMVVAMLRGPAAHEIRHGAALLGRLGLPDAAQALGALLDHPDDLVRSAAVHALGELHGAPVVDSLRGALRHPSARTRMAAAEAVATWRDGTLALLLAAALEEERDRDAWQAMVAALGRIGSAEACAALATIAVTRRSILRRRGYSTGQRLAAVAALGLAATAEGHGTLRRLAGENEGVVSYAADRLLQAERLRVG
jgi:HEAT repeat protein